MIPGLGKSLLGRRFIGIRLQQTRKYWWNTAAVAPSLISEPIQTIVQPQPSLIEEAKTFNPSSFDSQSFIDPSLLPVSPADPSILLTAIEKIGDFKELGFASSWTPVGWVEQTIELVLDALIAGLSRIGSSVVRDHYCHDRAYSNCSDASSY